jgi:hypothetical protein
MPRARVLLAVPPDLRRLSGPTAYGRIKHVSLGTFDDRNHASASVKLWLSRQEPAAYSVQNLKLLAREIVKGDREAVDHLEVKWRETSYGIVQGIVEFGVEEIERLMRHHPEYHPEYRSMRMALAALRRSLALLPGNATGAAGHIGNAAAYISDAGLPSDVTGKSLAALGVAQSLLGMGIRPVVVAA